MPMKPMRNKLPLLALSALLLTACSAATPRLDDGRPGGSLPAGAQVSAQGIVTYTLENGLTVIVAPNHNVPLATIVIAVHTGAYAEPPKWNGLMHFYEHLFFKGNQTIPDQRAFSREVRRLGIRMNGTTSDEAVNYYFTLPASNLEKGLAFMHHAITGPRFDEQEMETEKKTIMAEIDRNESQPDYHYYQAVGQAMFSTYFSRKDTLGDREVILTATPDTMREIQRTFYVPNNAALLVGGDVDPAEVLSLAQRRFGSWPRGEDPFIANPIPPHPPLKTDVKLAVYRDVANPVVGMFWHGPSVEEDPEATYAADVFSTLLGLRSSSFQKRLVESGLALSAGLSYQTLSHVGPISLVARTSPEKTLQLIGALEAELAAMLSPEYFSDEELQRAKQHLRINETYGRERSSDFTTGLSYWWCAAGIDYYLGYMDSLSHVTREDIQRFLERYIIGKHRVTALMISSGDAVAHMAGTDWTLPADVEPPASPGADPEATPRNKTSSDKGGSR